MIVKNKSDFNVVEGLSFFSKQDVLLVKSLNPLRSSGTKKWKIQLANGKRYFLKQLNDDSANICSLKVGDANGKVFAKLPVQVENYIAIFDWQDGKSFLKTLLYRFFISRKWLYLQMFALGEWLRQFHEQQKLELGWNALDEKTQIELKSKIELTKLVKQSFVKSFKDFTLRNMLITKDDKIAIVDLDAPFDPSEPNYCLPYHDLSIFTVNVLSLSRVPVISINSLRSLLIAFLAGYFKNRETDYDLLMFKNVFELHLEGKLIPHPLKEYYSGFLGKNFIRTFTIRLNKPESLLPTLQEIINFNQ